MSTSSGPRGLYVHIPFCLKKCHYCDYVITLKRDHDFRRRFFDALRLEISEAEARYGRLCFDTIYLGGGTPSALSGSEMTELLDLLRETFDFNFDYELTCEVNPGDVDPVKLETYRGLGINRISLGVQAFQDHLLKDMDRPHGVKEILETAALLKKTGFQNISMDLILKLPGQTIEDLESSLAHVVQLGASQVSFYDLEVHAQTVYGHRQRRGELILPPEDLHARMFDLVVSYLIRAGYEHYEVSNFARSGFASQHNLIYWHNQEYLGLGPGAFSYMNGVRYQFSLEVGRYLDKCEAGNFSRDTEDILSDEKKEMETLITGLRLQEGVSLDAFPIVRKEIEAKLPFLIKGGCVKREGDALRLTRRGKFLIESVLVELSQS
ncbi:MAG: radical SAM family heme chaperone HemW [Candidatus Omnitrophica bacterium]|nr:radical SAM family heme chaperone HemW [Candidatus Omnitrophota bacterium]